MTTLRGEKGAGRLYLCRCFVVPRFTSILFGARGRLWPLIVNLSGGLFIVFSKWNQVLAPKPKSTFRHLKQGIQDFHRKYVLVPADKAANNVVVVWRLHYINTLKQELSGTKAYKGTSEEEKSVVNGHCNHLALKFSVCVKERQDRLRSQHVSVESSSLLHHSFYLWFICFTWWSIDELENLHADRTTVCFEP